MEKCANVNNVQDPPIAVMPNDAIIGCICDQITVGIDNALDGSALLTLAANGFE
jgi:hypothetical protein